MARAFLIVLDSVGIGGAPDADRYFNDGVPDTGANTVGHVIENRGLNTPNLDALGLRAAVNLASGTRFKTAPTGAYGAATETSRGKDTPSGHWELAGLPVPFDWTYFPDENPAFPPDVTAALINAAGTDGILGNKHASGTAILEELGPEHMRTAWPICYTSVDSVLQIAAHEEVFGRERLYQMCEAMAPMLHKMRVGRVIARPFVGNEKSGFERTIYRRDFALMPPDRTLLDWAFEAGRPVRAIGKIGDIFAHRGVTDNAKGADRDLMEALIARAETAADGSLTFANFVEFDSKFGHRRDVEGYGAALEWFDAQLPRFLARLGPGDLAIFTADHGNDPTWIGTDHTRERVPVLVHGIGARDLGQIAFADVGASVADHLGLPERGAGRSFL